MSERTPRRSWEPALLKQRLQDVIHYGRSILQTLKDLSYDVFLADSIRQKAVAYDFQCISEATGKLLDMDPSIASRYPAIPWSSVRSLANITRHEYGRLDVDILWATATGNRLRELLSVAEGELKRLETTDRT